jgi:hypothetical protein
VVVGCQLDHSEIGSELANEASGDPCKATLPKPVIFDGTPPPKAEAGQAWVVLPPTKDGVRTAALVTADQATIPYLAIIPRGKLGGFVDDLGDAALAVFPGHPNPPPPVIDPDLLVFFARRAIEGVELAQQDARTCSQ